MDERVSNELKRFNRLVGEIDGLYHDVAVKLGLSDSELNILYAVCGEGDCCPLRDIYHQYGVSKQTINSAIRKMEREGLVYLEVSGGRSKDVRLTDKGKKLAGRTVIPLMELESEIFADWRQNEVEQYLRLAQQYLDAFRKKVKRFGKQKGPDKGGLKG